MFMNMKPNLVNVQEYTYLVLSTCHHNWTVYCVTQNDVVKVQAYKRGTKSMSPNHPTKKSLVRHNHRTEIG